MKYETCMTSLLYVILLQSNKPSVGDLSGTFVTLGHLVAQLAEALCYKLEGRGFESQ
jgi:hypothetical protein